MLTSVSTIATLIGVGALQRWKLAVGGPGLRTLAYTPEWEALVNGLDGTVGIARNAEADAFGEMLRDLRGDLAEAMAKDGVTRAELARRLGVRPSVVTRVMDPSADVLVSTLFDLARVLQRRWRFRLEPDQTGPSNR